MINIKKTKFNPIIKIILVTFLFCIYSFTNAQTLTVKFEEDKTDLEAYLNEVKDVNGEKCALIKVFINNIPIEQIRFDTKGIEFKKIEYKPPTQIWIYAPPQTLGIIISTTGYGNLNYYEFPTGPLKSTKTYIMDLKSDKIESTPTNIKNAKLQNISENNLLIFNDIPESAMILVTGGSFTMGHNNTLTSNYDRKWRNEDKDNEPEHTVELSDFYIGKFEVTQKLWEKVMGENPSIKPYCDKCPVNNISWNDCQDFIQKLNELTGKKYRLPTEAEWEYAANGGIKKTYFTKYAGSDYLEDVAWYFIKQDIEIYDAKINKKIDFTYNDFYEYITEDDRKRYLGDDFNLKRDFIIKIGNKKELKINIKSKEYESLKYGNSIYKFIYDFSEIKKNILKEFYNMLNPVHIVGTKKPNKLEIYDLTGNVAEFCMDYFGQYRKKKQINPTGSENGTLRVLRGGSVFQTNIEILKNYKREPIDPSIRNPGFGLRLAQ